jgi:peptide-methionine (S)-S-oxide reductase
VAHVIYDDALINFDELLEAFWFVHDPTQLNRQGNDIGTQYRSVIFFHDDIQKATAESVKQKLENAAIWDKSIVTEIVAFNNYFEAEQYHHNYLALNPQNSYCQMVVRPKYEKFKKVFEDRLK